VRVNLGLPMMVSILLPTLNAIAFLQERIDSIFSQTYHEWELIVCDSYSEDGTWEFLQQFAGDPRVRLFRVPREGLYAGWNECLARCRGEFVHFATADDTCVAEFLERMTGALEACPPASLGFSGYHEIDSGGRVIGHHGGGEDHQGGSSAARFLRRWAGRTVVLPRDYCLAASCHMLPLWTTMSAVVFRRSMIGEVGMFPSGFGTAGDCYWAMRCAAASSFVYVGDELATWRRHSGQATFAQGQIEWARSYAAAFGAAKRDVSSLVAEVFPGVTGAAGKLFRYGGLFLIDQLKLDRGWLMRDPIGWVMNFGKACSVSPLACLMHLARLGRYRALLDPAQAFLAVQLELGIPDPEEL
jgi:glycosyltransferase involved in cell wall biosynthesis